MADLSSIIAAFEDWERNNKEVAGVIRKLPYLMSSEEKMERAKRDGDIEVYQAYERREEDVMSKFPWGAKHKYGVMVLSELNNLRDSVHFDLRKFLEAYSNGTADRLFHWKCAKGYHRLASMDLGLKAGDVLKLDAYITNDEDWYVPERIVACLGNGVMFTGCHYVAGPLICEMGKASDPISFQNMTDILERAIMTPKTRGLKIFKGETKAHILCSDNNVKWWSEDRCPEMRKLFLTGTALTEFMDRLPNVVPDLSYVPSWLDEDLARSLDIRKDLGFSDVHDFEKGYIQYLSL